jgi:hypothetical protein
MAYQINKTDGTVLTTVADGQIDQVSTDITLIGKNFSGFGESLNENLVRMLENFSNGSEPERPLRGQLWFDTRDLKLKIYNGNQFLPVSSATLSRTQPTTLAAGDLWYDETRGQLFFFDGNSLKLLGPEWTTSQGTSGLVASNVFDNANNNRVIVSLFCGGVLLGIFSKDSFTPRSPISGYVGPIVAGFNASNLAGLKFNVTATNSETLGKDTEYPLGIPASSYLRNDVAISSIEGILKIESQDGLRVGNQEQLDVSLNGDNVIVKVKRTSKENAMVFSPSVRKIQIYPNTALEDISGLEEEAAFDKNLRFEVNGNMRVTGKVIALEGFEEETIIPKNSAVNERTIYLAVPDPEFPDQPFEDRPFSDILADGGGLVLKGDNDHSITWTQESVAWNFSEHINLVSSNRLPSPEFKIDGVTVINANSLGPTITSAPGITNFGVQDFVNIGRESVGGAIVAVLKLQGTKLEVLEENGNLELQPNGIGSVSVIGGARIIGVGDPVQNQDVATKRYVDTRVETRPIVFSMDLSDNKSDSYIITNILNNMAPVAENREGTVARILCTIQTNANRIVDVNSRLNVSTEVFSRPSGTGLAVTGVTVSPVTIPGSEISLIRIVKVFSIIGGQWTFVSSNELPL